MLWNTLSEAAAWLTEVTGTTWSVRQVLDAAIRQNSRKILDYLEKIEKREKVILQKHPRMTCLEAVMPRKTQFGYYERDKNEITPDNPNGLVRKRGMPGCKVELTRFDLDQLFLYGEVPVRIAVYPKREFGMEEVIMLIEPVDQVHVVTLEMVVIRGAELEALATEFAPSIALLKDENTKRITNKLAWTDTELRAILDEYNQPGMTHSKLAKKFGVTRARIGQVLKKASEFDKLKMPIDITQQLMMGGSIRKIKGNRY
jgi:hypothetical protein